VRKKSEIEGVTIVLVSPVCVVVMGMMAKDDENGREGMFDWIIRVNGLEFRLALVVSVGCGRSEHHRRS